MVNKKNIFIFYITFFLFTPFISKAQEEEQDPNIEKVQGLVSFYRFMLNTIGSSKTPSQEKEVIIKNSYEKVFRDEQVQIEDDLLTDRTAIINKNVQAYLRDVDFFFNEIQFEFADIEITPETTETGNIFYLVSFVSTREGITLDGESFKTSQDRYMEVNTFNDGLKIVSVYSTKVSREEELALWWQELGQGWVRVLKEIGGFEEDSLTGAQLLTLASLDSLDLSGKSWVIDIEPLYMMRNLRYLNLNETNIADLSPLRYASNLQGLEIAKTPVSELEILNYFGDLKYLNIAQSRVMDLAGLAKITKLKKLNISNLDVLDYSIVEQLTSLEELNISFSTFANDELLKPLRSLKKLTVENSYLSKLEGLSGLTELNELNISYTYINNLGPISTLKKLRVVYFNHTDVHDLQPLNGLPKLEKIYADYTRIREQEAVQFMRQNPSVLVVTNTEKVMSWWEGLSAEWKNILEKNAGISVNNDTENLIKLLQIDSINISGLKLLMGDPLSEFTNLRYLNVDGNLFTNLDFLTGMKELRELSARELPVDDISPLINCPDIENLDLSGLLISDLTPLFSLEKINVLNIEKTKVESPQVIRFLTYSPESIVLFDTEGINSWWEGLDANWKQALKPYINPQPNSRDLHRLVEMDSLVITNVPITDLSPVTQFIRLKYLRLSGTGISDLSSLVTIKTLVSLSCENGPLTSLESIYSMFQLQELSISNTPVDDLDGVSSLRNLKKLDCSGTQIKNIRDLRQLKSLRYLDISNTRVWQLHWLYEMPDFEVLICFNSRVKERKLDEFRSIFPECEVTFY